MLGSVAFYQKHEQRHLRFIFIINLLTIGAYDGRSV